MRDVEPLKLTEYAAEDADITLELAHKLEQKLDEQGLLDFAINVEFPLSEVLVDMEFNGIAIDTKGLADISLHIKTEVQILKRRFIMKLVFLILILILLNK